MSTHAGFSQKSAILYCTHTKISYDTAVVPPGSGTGLTCLNGGGSRPHARQKCQEKHCNFAPPGARFGARRGGAAVTSCTCDPNAPITAICWLRIDYMIL